MAEIIQELINKIKSEGIETADKMSKDIIADAKNQSRAIIEQAKKQAEQIIADAKKESEQLQQSTRMSLKQAARDMILTLRQEVREVLKQVIDQEVRDSLTPDNLMKIIHAVIERSIADKTVETDIHVFLNEQDCQKIKEGFIAKLQKELKQEIYVHSSEDVTKGFTISFDGGKSQFDFTDESLAQYMSACLNPYLAELMKEAVVSKENKEK